MQLIEDTVGSGDTVKSIIGMGAKSLATKIGLGMLSNAGGAVF